MDRLIIFVKNHDALLYLIYSIDAVMLLRRKRIAIYLMLSSKVVPKKKLFGSFPIMLLQNSDYQRL